MVSSVGSVFWYNYKQVRWACVFGEYLSRQYDCPLITRFKPLANNRHALFCSRHFGDEEHRELPDIRTHKNRTISIRTVSLTLLT
ncbi:hypothetical protein OAD57_04875 [Porticoccaceae bacterium]|nr:hypothetical protein [Porticoccaceae bacterium]